MADNVTADAGSGGAVFATDDVSSVHYPITKITIGAMDSAGTVLTGGNGTVDAGCLRVTVASDSTGVLSVDDNGGALTVDWNGTAPPIGAGVEATALRVTLATDSTGVVSIDDGGGAITVDGTVTANLSATDNAVLDNIQTSVDTIAAAVSTEMQVDVVAALPAGTNAIGKLAANSGVDIGDVDVLSVVPGTGATNLGKAIDGIAGATDTGVAPLAIRDDTLSALTPAEGDWTPLRVGSTGALHVTGAGGGTQYNIDDAGGATDTGTLALAIRDDALTTLTPVDGDYVGLRVSSTGALHVTGGGGGTEYTEDVATANPIVGTATLMERDDALSAVTPIEGDWIGLRGNARGALWCELDTTNAVTVDWAGTAPPIGAGTEAAALRVTLATDSTGVVSIDDNGGAITVDGTVTANLSATDNAVLDNIQTSVDTIAAAVSTEMQVDVVAALPAGTNAIGKLAANSGVDIGDVDVLSIAAGTNNIGQVSLAPQTTGGLTPFKSIDLDETEEAVKASAGQIYGFHVMNLASAKRYLKLYDATVATVVVGTTVPDITIPLPTQGDTNGAGFTWTIPEGIAFATAITAAATTGIADNDSGAPGANEVVITILYK